MNRHGTTTGDTERLMTVNDAAQFLAVSRDTIYRLVRANAFPHVKVGDRMRFRKGDIDAYLRR